MAKYGRKGWSSPNWGSSLAFFWTDWGKRRETSLIGILVDLQTSFLPNKIILFLFEQTWYVTFNYTRCLRRVLLSTRLIFFSVSCFWRDKEDVFNCWTVYSTCERVDMSWQNFLWKCAIVSNLNAVIFNLLHAVKILLARKACGRKWVWGFDDRKVQDSSLISYRKNPYIQF